MLLAEDPNSIPSIHFQVLETICKSSSRGSNILVWPKWNAHAHTHTLKTNKIDISKWKPCQKQANLPSKWHTISLSTLPVILGQRRILIVFNLVAKWQSVLKTMTSEETTAGALTWESLLTVRVCQEKNHGKIRNDTLCEEWEPSKQWGSHTLGI